ncbi:MAG: type IV secretory system conjugative DNA transfer family protein, partial [Pseudomonadota bacterium]
MRSFFARRRARTIDPEGRRLLGASLESGAPILAPRGHGLLLSANGGGKTTRGAMPWLFSLAAGKAAGGVAILDSKDGEMAIQAVPMLARMGVKVAVIDDLERWPQLAPWRIKLSPFGAAAEAQARDRRDAIFAVETATFALVEEPKDDSKNIYFRAWPRNLIGFAKGVLLARDPETATPGGVAAILADPDMLKGFAEIEAEEGEEPLRSLARSIRDMIGHEHWPQHLEEAQRALRLFAPGTRLHEVGRDATHTHADLIRE